MRISDWSSDVCSSDLRTLLIDEQLIEEARLARATDQARSNGEETLGVITTLLLGYEIGQPDEKREMLRLSISNLWVDRKDVGVALHSPYQEAADLLNLSEGELFRNEVRTGRARKARLKKLVELIVGHSTEHEKDALGDKISHSDSNCTAIL